MPTARAHQAFRAGYARRLELALAASLVAHLVTILVVPPHPRGGAPVRILEPLRLLDHVPAPEILILDPEPEPRPSLAAARAIGPMPVEIVTAPVPDLEFPNPFAESREPNVPGGAGDLKPWDSAPAVLARVEPRYPSIAREAGAEGTVWIQVRIEADGSVSGARVVRSDTVPALERAAQTAALGWLFAPARWRDVAVPCLVEIPFRFSLD